MSALNAEESLRLIFVTLPEFRPAFDAHRAKWGDELPGLCNDFAALGNFVIELVNTKHIDRLPALFDLIERFVVAGEDEVQNAATTCFLENLINVSTTRIPAAAFVPLLGPKSRAYCQAWDRFTGVKTPGLWEKRS